MSSCALIDLLSTLMDQSHFLPQLNLQQKRDLIFSLAELKEKMQVPAHCQDLNQYLATFELPLKLMQSAQGIRTVAKAFHEQLDAEAFSTLNPALHQVVLLQEVFLSKKFLKLLLLVELTSMQSIHSQRSTRHTLFALCVAQVKSLSTKMKSQLIWLQRTLEKVL